LIALAVPLTWLVLALIRPAPRRVVVGSLNLWERALARVGSARQPVDVLPIPLLLGLLGATVLVAAWAGPRFEPGAAGRRVRVVLDRSAAMTSLRPDGRTRWEEARQRCAAFLRSFSDDDRVDLIVVPDADLGPAFPQGRPSQLADRVAALTASTAEADWLAALRARAIEPMPTAVFTARPPAEPVGDAAVELIGGRGDNLALTLFAAVELPDGRRQILAEVGNTGTVEAAAEVALFAGTAELPETADDPGVNGPRRLRVPPGQVRRRYWTGRLPAAATGVRAELRLADARADDNAASTPLTTGGRLRVAVIGSAEPNLDRLLAAHPRVTRVDTTTAAAVVIAVGAVPPADFAGHVVLVNPPAGAGIELGSSVEKCVLTRVAPDAGTVFRHGDLIGLPLRRLTAPAPAGALNQRATAWVEPGGAVAAAEWENPPGRRWIALGFSCDRQNVPTDSAGRWAHRGLVVFWGRLLDSFLEGSTEPDAASLPPLAPEDRPLDAASFLAGLPREATAPPRELSLWLAVVGAGLLLAAWSAGARK
jgi:hypothetical protein